MKKQLEQLGELSNMILDLRLADLQNVTERANRIHVQNSEMRQEQTTRAAQLVQATDPDPALFNGQDEAWNKWAQVQLKARNIKLAKIYAEREERLADARQAMGRAEVIKSLLKKHS